MKHKEVAKDLASRGMSFKKTEAGDYRVNFKGGKEATAYYTNHLGDAHATGTTMSKAVKHLNKQHKD